MLIGHCFIPDGKDESETQGGQEEGHPAGDTLRKNATIPRRDRQLRGLEMAGRPLGSSPTRQLVRIVAETGPAPSMSRGKVGHVRPTVGGKARCKEFRKGGLKRPQRFQPGMVALHEIHRYQ